ncbi:MAG TPA: chemotaxis protein CheA [Candidatus Acidoferrum sp.]
MSFLPEERNSELRSLFFETAAELLQTINDSGLQLERHPADEELLRSLRRAIHTLKGDSAACGFSKLSEIAHELEDVLSLQVSQAQGAQLAEVILSAVDTFENMLSSYQRQTEPPPPTALRHLIHALLESPESKESTLDPQAGTVPADFQWSEYERLMISEARLSGSNVFNIALRIDPNSAMRAAAFQLVRNVLHACGTVIALRPEDNLAAAKVEIVEAAVASTHPMDHVSHRCRIPSIVSDVRIEDAAQDEGAEHQLLGDILEAQAAEQAAHPDSSVFAENKGQTGASAVAALAESSLRVEASRIDAVMNLVGELIIGKSMLNRTLAEFDVNHARDPVRAKLAETLAFQSRILDELHKCVLKIRMVPVEQLFRRFPRVVRDVAKLCGKDIALEVAGEHTDLDKSILDALAEPLTHLVRNAVDHGIEPADERLSAGKPARGTVYLNAYHQGTQVVIEIRDDGRGIDLDLIRAQAIRSGLLKKEDAERLTEQDVLNLIFEPGFSTATEITEVSGRGVGMDVVRTVLDRLKGTVHVSSSKNKGTTMLLRVPLTLASIQTLLFRVGGRLFAVPLSSVVEITRISDQEIQRVDQREVLRLRDQILTLVRLNSIKGIHSVEPPNPHKKKSFVIVIGIGEKRFGLLVDTMVGEEELVIKALPGEIVSSDLVSGASILGDGTVVLILNVPAILSRLSRSIPLGAIA